MKAPKKVIIEYHRPGKDITLIMVEFVFVNNRYIKTFKLFPAEVSESLTRSLQENGFSTANHRTVCITKVYFAETAQRTFERLICEVRQGIYPDAYRK